MVATLLAIGLCGTATAAQNLQDFFGLPFVLPTIGKLRADNQKVTCTKIVSKLPAVCSDASYAAQCVSGTCGCINYTCTNTGGTASNGSGTLEMGFDFANGPTLGLTPDCYPIFGVYTAAAGKKDKIPEETNFAGVACDPLSGQVAQINGGWQLVDFSTPPVSNGAGGTLTGTLNLGTSALKLTLKGETF